MTDNLKSILKNNPSLAGAGLDEDTLAVANGNLNNLTKRISIQGKVFRKIVGGKEVSTVENSYMNDAINTPRTTVDFINSTTASNPFLMMPYEKWDGESSKDNEKAMKFWDDAYVIALQRDLIKQKKTYSLDEIHIAYDEMVKRVKKKSFKSLKKVKK